MLTRDFVIQKIMDAYDILSNTSDLSPRNSGINTALSLLVSALSKNYEPEMEAEILQHPKIVNIREEMLGYLAEAEGEMEKFWADIFMQKDKLTLEDLKTFWYWDNYEELTDQEIKHLPYTGYTSKIQEFNIAPDESIAFVGGGALPLTAIIMHMKTNMRVTCIDNDPDACLKARSIIHKLGMQKGIEVVCSDGAHHCYRKNPFVFIASLVPNKEEVLTQVSKSERQNYVAIRSAEKLHTLLYEPVDEQSEEISCCRLVERTKYNPRIINTTLFYHSDPGWHMDLEKRRTKGIRYHKFGFGNRKTI